MANLLRSDFYRLFKSKSFYICAVLSMFFMALNIFLADWAIRVAGEKSGMSELPWKDGISYGLRAFSDGNAQMLIAIIISIFVAAEFTHGTMKNVVSKGFSKTTIYLSKLVTMIVVTFITILLTLVTGIVSATIVTGNFGKFTAEVFKISGIELLLYTALTAVFLFVAMTIKNLGGVIAINIIGIKFVDLIFNILQYVTKGKIKFTEYSLFNNITFYASGTAKGSDYLRSTIVGLAFLILVTILGIFLFKKADVK